MSACTLPDGGFERKIHWGGFEAGGSVPEIGLLAGQFLLPAQESNLPSCDASGGIIFTATDLKFGAVGALEVCDLLFYGFGLKPGIGLAVFKAYGDGLGAVIRFPKNSVIVAKAVGDLGLGHSAEEQVITLKLNGRIHCADGISGVQVVVFDLGYLPSRTHTDRRAGCND